MKWCLVVGIVFSVVLSVTLFGCWLYSFLFFSFVPFRFQLVALARKCRLQVLSFFFLALLCCFPVV